MKIKASLAIGLIGLSGCSDYRERPVPLGTDTYYVGYIDKGERLGATIGEDRMVAREHLSERHDYYQAHEDSLGNIKADHETCDAIWQKSVACKTGDMFDYNRVRELGRDGHMLVFFDAKHHKVSAIHWATSLTGTIDF